MFKLSNDIYRDENGDIDFAAMLRDVLPAPGCEMCGGSGKIVTVVQYGDSWTHTNPTDCECVAEQHYAIEEAEAEAEREAAAGWED